MGQKLPHLKPKEVQRNLASLGFEHKRTNGSHETWERKADHIIAERKIVQVDVGKKQFDDYLMKSMIRQSGLNRGEFCTGVMDASRLIVKLTPAVAAPNTTVPKKVPSVASVVPAQVPVSTPKK